ERDLERRRRAVARPGPRRTPDRLDQSSWRMAVDERSPRHDVIDVLVTVDILETRPVGAADEERVGTDRLERADGTVDAARKDVEGAREKTGGAGRFHGPNSRHENTKSRNHKT